MRTTTHNLFTSPLSVSLFRSFRDAVIKPLPLPLSLLVLLIYPGKKGKREREKERGLWRRHDVLGFCPTPGNPAAPPPCALPGPVRPVKRFLPPPGNFTTEQTDGGKKNDKRPGHAAMALRWHSSYLHLRGAEQVDKTQEGKRDKVILKALIQRLVKKRNGFTMSTILIRTWKLARPFFS